MTSLLNQQFGPRLMYVNLFRPKSYNVRSKKSTISIRVFFPILKVSTKSNIVYVKNACKIPKETQFQCMYVYHKYTMQTHI